MLNLLISLLGIIVTILLVVGIHELGHFLVAKSLGIKVLRFSIGFGKSLFSWHDKQGTEYVLAAIPLGGYVKMLDEGEGTVVKEELHLAYNRQPLYKRLAIIIAGPLFNLIFAFAIYWLLFVIGFNSIAPIIGKVLPHSIAEQAGLKPQQEIVQIDNKPSRSWMAVVIHILMRSGEKTQLQVEVKPTDSTVTTVHHLNLADWHMDNLKPEPLESLGITPYEPFIPATIDKLLPDAPAAKAGLQRGDKILAVNTKPIPDWQTLIQEIIPNAGKTLTFTIERQGKKMTLPVTLGTQDGTLQKQGYLGIKPPFQWPDNLVHKNQYDPLAAIPHAFQNTLDFTNLNFLVLGKIFTGKMSLQSLGGPITIFESAGTALNQGIIPFLSFLAFLSISIGVINILPIPGLDGGHVLFLMFEAIFRHPLSIRAQTLFYRFGIILLLLVFAQALINDIMRLH